MNSIITLNDYLNKGKEFFVPDYQRGYVWGKERNGEKNSVENLLDNLLIHYDSNTDVFLQGVTVSEDTDKILLIDGQQRTTCLYLLLKWLGYNEKFAIRYEVREEADKFLQSNFLQGYEENSNEEYQDIYYFKKTLRIIKNKFSIFDEEKKRDFLHFLLHKIKFLYVIVPEQQATQIFAMMNGNKALMQEEELIKAEILRIASQCKEEDTQEEEWEHFALRSRYAREWDRWLHWWNQQKVRDVFHCNNTMGLLISTYFQSKGGEHFSFENFKQKCLKDNKAINAKTTFDELRRLQKRFEDAYNNSEIHNRIGGILCVFDKNNAKEFIKYYFTNTEHINLEEYYLLVFLGMTHKEIVEKNIGVFQQKYEKTLADIKDNFLYFNNKETAFQFLLRLNIDQDILQKRFFNFQIWKERSIEHIYPKSKVVYKDEKGNWRNGKGEEIKVDELNMNQDKFLKREDIRCIDSEENGKEFETTEHGIGNLVLLYKDENSKFNDSNFVEKKEMFFSPNKKELFKSRHLLHTICVFAEKEKWDGSAIASNKKAICKKIEEDYEELFKQYQERDNDEK